MLTMDRNGAETATTASTGATFAAGATLDASTKARIAESVSGLLRAIGPDNLDPQGTLKTPTRVAEMYDELLSGYSVQPAALLNGALFDVEYNEMVVVKSIEFYSLCEHHMLPFFGHAHVGYLPRNKVVGLSKIPRVVETFARRLQVQERMTQQIAQFIECHVEPVGVGVVVEAAHMCAMMRGVGKQSASMVTSALLGAFQECPATRQEFMMHVRDASRA